MLKIVTLSDINSELGAFNIGKNDRGNIPPILSPSTLKHNKLTGSAAKKTGVYSGTYHSLLDITFQKVRSTGISTVYHKCREIGDIILSHSIRKSIIPVLSFQIGEFLSSFLTVFPDTFTPKLHYLIHYPCLTLSMVHAI